MYHGISRPDPTRISRSKPPRHDRWQRNRLRGILRLRLTTGEGCYVAPGTGLLRPLPSEGEEVVAQAAARAATQPVVPGTGIKGAVRTLYELTSASCDPLAWKRNGEKCGPRGSCEACSLFGCLGYQGRVSFDDARPAGAGARSDVEWVPTPREPHGEKTGGEFRLYDLAPAVYDDALREKDLAREVYRGTFETRLRFVNLEEVELGRLLFCLGLAEEPRASFPLRLGGIKYDGQGAVEVEPVELALRTGALGRESLEGAECRKRCAEAMAAARESSWAGAFWATLEEAAALLRRRESP